MMVVRSFDLNNRITYSQVGKKANILAKALCRFGNFAAIYPWIQWAVAKSIY